MGQGDPLTEHAGKLLLAAFAAPIPLRAVAMGVGSLPLMILADTAFVTLAVLSVVGYVRRRRWR